ncbi:MAG: acyl-CoA dehydrogenase [Chloroflexi bacterium]|nr:MAG: acyl-CoA dehydrogenase [Chloroflexota bacterium]
MAAGFVFPVPEDSERVASIRAELRGLLAAEQAAGTFTPRCDGWLTGWSEPLSRSLGAHGWIGVTWPERYGGREFTVGERYVITEELLAAGAPVAAHWIADRQVGPLLLRYGTEEQRQEFLPRIARGECYFAIGMSEPDAGSDLAAIRTSAKKVDGGWLMNGRKLWTSGAHHSHYSIVLCRTSPMEENRRNGMSQLLVDLHAPGVTIRPIILLNGEHHFNEMIFDDVFVPDSRLVGTLGNGWNQVLTELAFERSGPERFMSTFPLLVETLRIVGTHGDARAQERIGSLISQLWAVRALSLGVAGQLDSPNPPATEAALVKDIGTRLEREIIEVARSVVETEPHADTDNAFQRLLAQAILQAPGFTLRGGTNEILRGIIARGLGLR